MEKKPKAHPTPKGANKTNSASSLPADLSVDDPQNYNFEGMPAEELRACCFWEYARESAYIRNTLQPRRDKLIERGRALLAGKGFSITGDGIIEYFARMEEENLDIFLGGRSFPAPWRSLTSTEREARAETIRDLRDSMVPPPVMNGHWNVVENCADRAKGAAFPPPGLPVSEVLLSIDWDAYSNDQIIEHLRKWLPTKRPPAFPNRKGRPKGTFDPFAALDGLAIMRLTSLYTPADAKAKAPALFNRHKGKQLFRTRHTVKRDFRLLFPYLPASDWPLSWTTKAGRSR